MGLKSWFDSSWSRVVLAGPVVFIVSLLLASAASVWLPKGQANIDNIALPLVLFPLIWGVLFFYSCLSKRLVRTWLVLGFILLVNGAIVLNQIVGQAEIALPEHQIKGEH